MWGGRPRPRATPWSRLLGFADEAAGRGRPARTEGSAPRCYRAIGGIER